MNKILAISFEKIINKILDAGGGIFYRNPYKLRRFSNPRRPLPLEPQFHHISMITVYSSTVDQISNLVY